MCVCIFLKRLVALKANYIGKFKRVLNLRLKENKDESKKDSKDT